MRQHTVHLFVMDGDVRTRTDHPRERASRSNRTNTFSWLHGAKPRARRKCEERKGFLGHGNRAFGQAAWATTGRSGCHGLVREGKSALYRVSTSDQEFLEAPPRRCILSGFPTIATASHLHRRHSGASFQRRSRNRSASTLPLQSRCDL